MIKKNTFRAIYHEIYCVTYYRVGGTKSLSRAEFLQYLGRLSLQGRHILIETRIPHNSNQISVTAVVTKQRPQEFKLEDD